MGELTSGRRIWLLISGVTLTALGCFLAWTSFAFLTAMMNPALEGADYREAIRERVQANPTVTTFLVLCCVGVLLGVVLMGNAIVGRSRRHA